MRLCPAFVSCVQLNSESFSNPGPATHVALTNVSSDKSSRYSALKLDQTLPNADAIV